jgi:hypothetical protein
MRTSMSGGTPSFSAIQPTPGSNTALHGEVMLAAVDHRVVRARTHQAAPGAGADERPDLLLAEDPGEVVAARAGQLVDEQHLGAEHAGGQRNGSPPGASFVMAARSSRFMRSTM